MPDPVPPSQPPRQPPKPFWLWAPYAAVLVALIAWSGVWWMERSRLEQTLDEQAARLRSQGYAASWTGLTIDGWPFRLHAVMTAPRFGEPSGWAVAAPQFEAVAAAYAPDRWVLAAPDGLTLTRPGKGPLAVSGRAIRASVGALGSAAPRLSFEGLDVTLAQLPGGQPAAFSSAARLEAHLQPGPDDQAAFLIRVEDAQLQPDSGLGRLVPGKPFALTWDSRLSHLSAFKAPNWPAPLQAWAKAGGSMSVVQARIALGGLVLNGAGGPLTADPGGRLQGALPLTLEGGKASDVGGIAALVFTGPVELKFQDGRATLGPIPIGPALKVG